MFSNKDKILSEPHNSRLPSDFNLKRNLFFKLEIYFFTYIYIFFYILSSIMVYLGIFFFFFLWPHLRHMEVPRLGAELELQLPANITVTATLDSSHICDLHCSLRQCWILNPSSRDWICILMDAMLGSQSTEPPWEPLSQDIVKKSFLHSTFNTCLVYTRFYPWF